MKKILKIFGKLDSGGAEIRTLELIKELNKRNTEPLEFHILVLGGQKGLLDEKFLENGVQIHYIRLKDKAFIGGFIKLIKVEKINVLYSNVYLFSGVFMLFGWLLGIPQRITHIRTLHDERKGVFRKIRNRVLKLLIKIFSTNLVGVNKAVIIENFGEKALENSKVMILYNGIAIGKESDNNTQVSVNKDTEINIIHIGRQVNAKNHLKVIKVFIEINKMYFNSNLHLIGKQDNDITKRMESLVEQKGIKHRVNFLGVQENIDKHFKNKDLLIFPSFREGLPGVVLEAQMNGVPVLASDISPHVELGKYFSTIFTLSNDAEDVFWAAKALVIIDGLKENQNKPIRKEFMESPFLLENHIKNYLLLLKSNE